jgi:uncharacterized SAM-binding protein YcdF (DUF218 family)
MLLRRRLPRLGTGLAVAAALLLVLASLPVTARALLAPLEHPRPLDPAALAQARAVVILAGGIRPDAPEYGGSTVSPSTLERLRYGARLHHRTGLPVVVSGGLGVEDGPSEAWHMRRALREFGVDQVSLEQQSSNTAENARFTARLLGAGRPVILVTHAAHMSRAVEQFEAAGLRVIPAPTGFTSGHPGPALLDWLPSAGAMALTTRALHEWVGRFWYAVRY